MQLTIIKEEHLVLLQALDAKRDELAELDNPTKVEELRFIESLIEKLEQVK